MTASSNAVAVPLAQLLRETSVELVSAVLQQPPAALRMRAHAGATVDCGAAAAVHRAAERLATGMPFAYAVGTAAFRHLLLHVDERVLIPRPETELLVDHVLRLRAGQEGGTAIDVGTGSGAIALALAQEGAFSRLIATDISADALDVARANARRCADLLPVAVEFRLGSDLAPVLGLQPRASVIVSNPPYIGHDDAAALPALVRNWEPPTALFAAEHGQARYRALLRDAPRVLEPGGWLVLECDSLRADTTRMLAESDPAYTDVQLHADLTGRPRILVARLAHAPPDELPSV